MSTVPVSGTYNPFDSTMELPIGLFGALMPDFGPYHWLLAVDAVQREVISKANSR